MKNRGELRREVKRYKKMVKSQNETIRDLRSRLRQQESDHVWGWPNPVMPKLEDGQYIVDGGQLMRLRTEGNTGEHI